MRARSKLTESSDVSFYS
jgi:hypothetical protein